MKKIPERINDFFKSFCSLANKSCPSPEDIERFCTFIMACHLGRSKIHKGTVAQFLEKEGFDNETAEHLGDFYEIGRELLRPKHRAAIMRWGLDKHPSVYEVEGKIVTVTPLHRRTTRPGS